MAIGWAMESTGPIEIRWAMESTGIFSVSSARRAFDFFYLKKLDGGLSLWNNWLPQKICFNAWRVALTRLPTRSNLEKRGIILLSNLCMLCGEEEETEVHIFTSCSKTRGLLLEIGAWWGVDGNHIQDLKQLFTWGSMVGFTGKKNKAFMGVVYIYLWLIWKWRNGKTFSNLGSGVTNLIPGQVQALSFLWYKNRIRNCNLANRWLDWCLHPYSCI